jgi:cation diffusion facilitator family transporter
MIDQHRQAARVATLSVVSNSLLVILKIAVGLFIGSVSVLSEAIHSGIDLIAAVIALFAVKQAGKPADEDHPYGHGKFENASGTVEAILIFFAAAWIIYEAVHKFRSPQPLDAPGWGVGLMAISAIVNWLVSETLFRTGKKVQSIALEADAWHLRTDVYTSLGVMGGLLAIWLGALAFPGLNLNWIDPAAAILVALLIVKAAWDLTRQAARDLFDVSLPEEELAKIRNLLRSHKEISGFHRLRTRKSGKERFIEFHLVVNPNATVANAHALSDQITAEIKHCIADCHVMIHIEPCDKSCSEACLSGCFVSETDS